MALKKGLTPQENRLKRSKEKEEKHTKALKLEIPKCKPFDSCLYLGNPKSDDKATEIPRRTLFVGRLDNKVTEDQLKSEFSRCGDVKRLRIVRDEANNPKGYAFIEFTSSSDVKFAIQKYNERRIGDRKVVCDFERGRSDEFDGFLPRRLGGGVGPGRKAIAAKTLYEKALQRRAERESRAIGSRRSSSRILGRGRGRGRGSYRGPPRREFERRDAQRDDIRDVRRDDRRGDRWDDRRGDRRDFAGDDRNRSYERRKRSRDSYRSRDDYDSRRRRY